MAFNRTFSVLVDKWRRENIPDWSQGGDNQLIDEGLLKLMHAYQLAIDKGAMFDARVFNIPKEEVTNCIYWRQLDASRNSIQMAGQANFSHKELHGKTCSNIQDMLMEQKGINWNDFPAHQKRGSCVIKSDEWVIDEDIPVFKGEGREYIEKLIMVGE